MAQPDQMLRRAALHIAALLPLDIEDADRVCVLAMEIVRWQEGVAAEKTDGDAEKVKTDGDEGS